MDIKPLSLGSTGGAFAALKSDGSITAWGNVLDGGIGAPIDSGYINIYSTERAFAALKSDGSITAWGSSDHGAAEVPVGIGYSIPYGTNYAMTPGEEYEEQLTISVNDIVELSPPTVETLPIAILESKYVMGNGNVIDTGNEDPERFIEWRTLSGEYQNQCSAGKGGLGEYSCAFTDLEAKTVYYVRAKVVNSEGINYGEEINFTTPKKNAYKKKPKKNDQ